MADDIIFNGDYGIITTAAGVLGQPLQAEMCAIGMGYVIALNRQEDIGFIDSYDILPVENTKNANQIMETTTGDFLFRLQGVEIVAID